MFGFKLEAKYFPYFTIGLHTVMRGGSIPMCMVFGAVAAQIYYYLLIDYPQQGGRHNFIRTPQIYKWLLDQKPARPGAGSYTVTDDSSGYKAYKPSGWKPSTSGTTSTSESTLHNRKSGSSRFWGEGKTLK
ncbi:hypothetical protein BB558_004314 [Smittium angustum]|uniref:Derlin n=1 Tax=Smittium angustum TaxID=133377 RepID=A0A2U1J3M9_SMIAN|nr:hypothetical protein BB558_004314 [Smittium angustum]